MSPRPTWMVALLAILLALVDPAAAQTAAPGSSAQTSPATQYFGVRLTAGMTLLNYLQNLRIDFAQLDADGNGEISAADIALHDAVASAAARAMSALQIMGADLDGDGVVTEDELRQRLRYQRRISEASQRANPALAQNPPVAGADERMEREISGLMAADTNKDGRITWNEAIEFAKSRPNYAQMAASDVSRRARQVLSLAGDGDSAVTLAKVEAAGTAFFRSVDADGNGTISLDELQSFRQLALERGRVEAEETRVRKEQEARAGCAMPKASDAARVVLLGTYEAEALSATTIGSQDIAVGAGRIVIEPGEGPLYVVVASFRPTIWRVSGAVERVERLVLSSMIAAPNGGQPDETPLVGATGVASDRISFLPRLNCLRYFSESPSSDAASGAATVRRDTGKEPTLYGKYSVGEFILPSGQIHSAREDKGPTLTFLGPGGNLVIQGNPNVVVRSGPTDLAADLNRSYPGGVVVIDPTTVVASRPAEKYEVLPRQAGLIQLVDSGALKPTSGGELVIQQKMRFPAELNGAYSVRFLLLRGVPLPDGQPGNSPVISEETGQPIDFKRAPNRLRVTAPR